MGGEITNKLFGEMYTLTTSFSIFIFLIFLAIILLVFWTPNPGRKFKPTQDQTSLHPLKTSLHTLENPLHTIRPRCTRSGHDACALVLLNTLRSRCTATTHFKTSKVGFFDKSVACPRYRYNFILGRGGWGSGKVRGINRSPCYDNSRWPWPDAAKFNL